ncbi:MAG TPA: MBL fold metallo-hydrolase [Streptosporangiaceae bacterium]
MTITFTTVTSSENGLLSNTHLIDAPDGIIVVDPPMLLSDSRAVRQRLQALGRPLAAFIYTHPHPDHVNGATEIRGGQVVPVYATAETSRISKDIDAPKREYWTMVFPDDYPPETTFPTVLVEDGDRLAIAGLTFTVYDIGAGECATAAIWLSGTDAFVGDLVYSHTHPWLFEARTKAWLAQIDRARPLLHGCRLHVGHGLSGDVGLLDKQAAYIRAYVAAVHDLAQGKDVLDDQAKIELRRRMQAHWPHAPLGDLITMSADPVAAELALS